MVHKQIAFSQLATPVASINSEDSDDDTRPLISKITPTYGAIPTHGLGMGADPILYLTNLDESCSRNVLRWSATPFRPAIVPMCFGENRKQVLQSILAGLKKGVYDTLNLSVLSFLVYQAYHGKSIADGFNLIFGFGEGQKRGAQSLVVALSQLTEKSVVAPIGIGTGLVSGIAIWSALKRYHELPCGFDQRLSTKSLMGSFLSLCSSSRPKTGGIPLGTFIKETHHQITDYYKPYYRKPEYYLGFVMNLFSWFPPIAIFRFLAPFSTQTRFAEYLVTSYVTRKTNGNEFWISSEDIVKVTQNLAYLAKNESHQIQRNATKSLLKIVYSLSLVEIDHSDVIPEDRKTALKEAKRVALEALEDIHQKGVGHMNQGDGEWLTTRFMRFLYTDFLLWSLDPLRGNSMSIMTRGLFYLGVLGMVEFLRYRLMWNIAESVGESIRCPDKPCFDFKLGQYPSWADDFSVKCLREMLTIFRNPDYGHTGVHMNRDFLKKFLDHLHMVNHEIDTLDLNHKQLTDADLLWILEELEKSKLDKIGKLLLYDNALSFADPKLIQKVTNRVKTYLHIQQNSGVSGQSLINLSRAVAKSSIERFVLGNHHGNFNVSQAEFLEISRSFNHSKIKTLALVAPKVEVEAGGEFMCNLIKIPEIDVLNLYDLVMRMPNHTECHVNPHSQIEYFYMTQNTTAGSLAPIVDEMISSPHLKTWRHCEPKAPYLASITEGLKSSRLTELNLGNLWGCYVPYSANQALDIISALPNTVQKLDMYFKPDNQTALNLGMGQLCRSSVQELDVSDGLIMTDQTAATFGKCLPSSQIQSLNLRKTGLTDIGGNAIFQGLSGSRVSVLDMSQNAISDTAFLGAKESLANSALTDLTLTQSTPGNLSDAFADAMFGLPLPIQSLNLDGYTLNDVALYALSDVLQRTALFELTLTTPISDEVSETFGYALEGSQLKTLKLKSNMSEMAWDQVSRGFVRGIKTLDLTGSVFTEAAGNSIISKLPGSQIETLVFGDFIDPSIKYHVALTDVIARSTHLKSYTDNNFYKDAAVTALGMTLEKAKLQSLTMGGSVGPDVIEKFNEFIQRSKPLTHVSLSCREPDCTTEEIALNAAVALNAQKHACTDSKCNDDGAFYEKSCKEAGADKQIMRTQPSLSEYITTHQLMTPQPAALGTTPLANASVAANQSGQALLAGPGSGEGGANTAIALAVGAIVTATVAYASYVYRDHLRAGWRKMWGYFDSGEEATPLETDWE